ncbi:MAG: radical SAM protein [Candidatus Omnitrophota bacterium]
MKKFDILKAGYDLFIKTKLLQKRIPFFVSWAITYHCNYNCLYCGVNEVPTKDLDTKAVLSFIDQLTKAGTKIINFTGGEPMLRNDIGIILNYCKEKNIYVSINTSGYLLSDRAKQITGLDRIVLSLDGPPDVHDSIRGKGAYKNTMEAIKIAKNKGWEIKFTSVLSEINLDFIEFILKLAKKLEIATVFQPARILNRGSGRTNQILLNKRNNYQKIIQSLINYKLNKHPYIGNSLLCLKHFLNWPEPTKIPCAAGKIYCRIENNGFIKSCGDETNKKDINISHQGIKNAFLSLEPYSCLNCWIAAQIELNFLYSFKFDSIFNSLKQIYRRT